MMKTTTKKDYFEDMAGRIAEKTLQIYKAYFKHPIKTKYLEVPFVKDDKLELIFRRPIHMNYIVTLYDAEKVFKPSIRIYHSLATKMKLTITDGQVSFINIIYNNGDNHIDIKPNATSILATLFTLNTLETIEEAEIRSEHEETKNWFIELINIYKDFKSGNLQMRIEDLYDTKTINYVLSLCFISPGSEDIYYFETYDHNHKHSNVELRQLIILLHPYENMMEIMAIWDNDFPDIIHYSISKKRIVDKWKAFDALAMFSDSELDVVESFLSRFFNTYATMILAVSYMKL